MCYNTYFLSALDCRYQAVCTHGDSRLCCWVPEVLALLLKKKERFMGQIFIPFRIHSLQNETYMILYLFYVS